MRKFIILVFIILIAMNCPVWLPAEGVSLEEAIQRGLERSATYRNQALEEKSLELEKKTAQMKRFFSLDSAGSYLFKSEQMEIAFPGKSIKAGAKHNYDLNLSLKQPFFTGNILSNGIKLSELELAVAQNQALLEKIDIAAEIKSSYFNYHLLLDKRDSLETLIRQLGLHLKKIEDFFKEELVRKTDLLETRRKLREQELNVEDLNHLIAAEKFHFEKLCGLDIDAVAVGYVEKVDDYEGALAAFKSSHPLLQTLDRNLAMLSTRGKMVKGGYLPQVAGFAELHYGRPGLDFFKNQWQLYFQGGVSFSLKLFDWDKRKRDLMVLDYAGEKVKNQRDDFILEGEKLLKQLFDAKGSMEKKIGILDDLVGTAAEDVGLKADLYREQQVANIDYLDALTTKERYESMKKETMMQLELVKVSINRVIGKTVSHGRNGNTDGH
ncbi:MAG: TolC family protein [Acidobacteriota bacterium]|nr:TolC family protein [Acidobacteriota bacterium]